MLPMLIFWTDLIYLAISVTVALLVGWTLHRNGRVFLVEVYQGNESLADSVNHLILVGFYLVSIGFVAVAIRMGTGTGMQDIGGAIQVVSTKVGLVLLVLGVTHFLNLMMFSRMRWRVRIVATPENQQFQEHRDYAIAHGGSDVDLPKPAGVGQPLNRRPGK